MEKQPVVAFIGSGSITQSLIDGLIASGYNRSHLWATDRNEEKLKQLSSQFEIHTHPSNTKVVNFADVLILAVKPQDIETLALELKPEFKSKKPLIISVVAGIQTRHLERWFEANIAIVRAMPNTPALLRVGATGLYANSRVTEEQKNLAESLLRAVGITVWTNHEHDLDVVTALSGSGPAYFFLMMEALQQSAESLGLPSSTARILTLQTALGAARMALESDISLEALKKKVASPGGTTEQALHVLETGGLRALLKKALQSAKDRSIEISRLFDVDKE